MDLALRDRLVGSWRRHFGPAELPLAFEYRTEPPAGAAPLPRAEGHRCFIAQLIGARRGRTLCFGPDSPSCRGLARYLGYREGMFPGFEEFLSLGERYLSSPAHAAAYLASLPVLPLPGKYLVVRRWDTLAADDAPHGVICFARPDVLSALFTLAAFVAPAGREPVIAPFGAGCMSTLYSAYREQVEGTGRAVLGMFDPSARKCVRSDELTVSFPYDTFRTLAERMEESFLNTRAWSLIRKRLG